MKTDRELLELAAKAAGFLCWDLSSNIDGSLNVYNAEGKQERFDPLTNDGDALRLSVKFSMMIARRIGINGEFVVAEIPGRMFEAEPVGKDWYAATRRAIVRAAAAIGAAK